MHRRLPLLLTVLLSFGMIASPLGAVEDADLCRPLVADADDPAVDPFICEVDYWLQCGTAVGDKVSFYTPVTGNARFTDEPPPGSFTEGHGCGEPENSTGTGIQQDNIHDFTFEGFTDGNLDSIAVELHDFALGPAREEQITLGVRLSVEGASPFGSETGELPGGSTFEAPTFVDVPVQPVVSETGLTVAYHFTITGLAASIDSARNPGPGNIDYLVKMTIDTPANGAHILAWGAEEVPGGITINPLETRGTVVEAPPA